MNPSDDRLHHYARETPWKMVVMMGARSRRNLIPAMLGVALLALAACARSGEAAGPQAVAPAPRWEGDAMKTFAKPSDEEIRKRLTPEQYQVTQKEGTEPAFRNEYWDNKQPGLYVDVVSGEPLFSSLDKYDSGTGWPSFTRPLEPDALATHEDRTLGMSRVE